LKNWVSCTWADYEDGVKRSDRARYEVYYNGVGYEVDWPIVKKYYIGIWKLIMEFRHGHNN
jgi:hypothetical protein